MANNAASLKRLGDAAFSSSEKINSELLVLTYGAIVSQVISDFEDINEANKQLELMGYHIGERLIDEFLARCSIGRCQHFRDTAEVGFKMFLNTVATVGNWAGDTEYSLLFEDNPLGEFVELTDAQNGLFFSNIICGVLRGALESVHLKVECKFVKDVLRGDDCTEIRVIFKEILVDSIPVGDD